MVIVYDVVFVQSHLLSLIVYLYKPEQLKRMSSDVSISIPLALLYSRRFLRRLLAYTNVNTFMVHILPYITLGLIGGSKNALSDESTVWHQRSYTGGLTNETDYTNSSISNNKSNDEFNEHLNYNEEKALSSFEQPRSYALLSLSSSSSSKKQTMLNVDEIGIDLRNLLTDEEFQFAEDTKGLTEFTCQSFNDEECGDDITSHKSLTSGSNDEGVTRRYSPSSTSQTSKLSSQVIPDNSTEEKHANDIQKKVIPPDVTSICTNTTTSSSNSNSSSSSSSSSNCAASISCIPPITAAMDSLNWLAKRVGPVMTNKYIVKYLLGTLTLCYEISNQAMN
ncbi:unnamed protein product [Trichobilharzia regenti]|nr:unnamed protein product [Trichobilharzia regenti]